MISTCDLLKQEAASHLQSLNKIFTHLQLLYKEKGDENAKMALESLQGSIRNASFLSSAASGKNLQNNGNRKFLGPPGSETVSFTDRVKAIMRNAATKNGQKIKCNARGHAGEYTFYVDAEVFCGGIEKLLSVHERELKEYLGGSLNNVQVTKVCQFLGHVARMKVVNDSKLQLSDLAFAFETYYNIDTVKRKLSAKDLTCQEKEFFDFFKGVLKGVKTQIEAKRKLE